MKIDTTLGLNDRLRQCAEIWAAAAAGDSLAKLGRLVLNDTSFFNRPASRQGPTTATLEKFARFLVDPANWPDGAVPGDVIAFGHVTGVTAGAGEFRTHGAQSAVDDDLEVSVHGGDHG